MRNMRKFFTNSVRVQSLKCITMILLKQTISISFCLEVVVLINAPVPENTAFSVSIDLDNTGNSYASAVK